MSTLGFHKHNNTHICIPVHTETDTDTCYMNTYIPQTHTITTKPTDSFVPNTTWYRSQNGSRDDSRSILTEGGNVNILTGSKTLQLLLTLKSHLISQGSHKEKPGL